VLCKRLSACVRDAANVSLPYGGDDGIDFVAGNNPKPQEIVRSAFYCGPVFRYQLVGLFSDAFEKKRELPFLILAKGDRAGVSDIEVGIGFEQHSLRHGRRGVLDVIAPFRPVCRHHAELLMAALGIRTRQTDLRIVFKRPQLSPCVYRKPYPR
jgi:hypothetical protein